jgi:hypothetical protein
MDSRDEQLTLENVDEQIEQCLAQSQELDSSSVTSLACTVHNLQSIYTEERRLENVWTSINRRVSAMSSEVALVQADGLAEWGQARTPAFSLVREEKKALQDVPGGSAEAVPRRSDRQARLPFRRRWHMVGIGLAAAIILIVFLVWPVVSYALRGSWTPDPYHPFKNKGTPQVQPTVSGTKQTGSEITPTVTSTVTPTPVATPPPTASPSSTTNVLPDIKVYSGQYFTIQYPADWVIASVTTGGGYVQTVQFRPSATSSVFVNVNVMYPSNLTSDLLLLADTDVKQGTLQSTSSVTYNGVAWTVGIVDLSLRIPPSKLEVAYSNQGTPYRIEFGATSDAFSTYAPVFDTIFASFYPAS